ncbi:hypothetical protein [Pseudonocardia parietis]|uniref:Uncharacterized protein n=1 Tax=Pseudonocardia parietis TaxID=570936 RepID=A0ABS4VQN1_9PSEU|nr:hypothetical protein [Pseudonocardia parietis]MBP2366224.1 hypothetical protein [Pseudonocardia parietis]
MILVNAVVPAPMNDLPRLIQDIDTYYSFGSLDEFAAASDRV